MQVFKVYCTTRNKDGKILKSDNFLIKCNPEEVEEKAIKEAKYYGMKGNIYIGSIFVKDEQTKQFIKYN